MSPSSTSCGKVPACAASISPSSSRSSGGIQGKRGVRTPRLAFAFENLASRVVLKPKRRKAPAALAGERFQSRDVRSRPRVPQPARCPRRPEAPLSVDSIPPYQLHGDFVRAALQHLDQVGRPTTFEMSCSASSGVSHQPGRSNPPTVSCMRRTLPTRPDDRFRHFANRLLHLREGDPRVRNQTAVGALLQSGEVRQKRIDRLGPKPGTSRQPPLSAASSSSGKVEMPNSCTPREHGQVQARICSKDASATGKSRRTAS